MKHKLKILRIIASLDPKFGGPSRGVLESSKQLVKEGFKVDIVTCDKEKIKFTKLKNIKIINLSSYIGNSYRFSLKLYFWLVKYRDNYDYFIVHGIWQFNTLVARLVLKGKYLVFIHGQLDPFFEIDFLLSWSKRSVIMTKMGAIPKGFTKVISVEIQSRKYSTSIWRISDIYIRFGAVIPKILNPFLNTTCVAEMSASLA